MTPIKHSLLGIHKPIIGMIHVAALPATPRNKLSPDAIIDQAVKEALLYQQAGIDVIAIENMHDLPYLKGKVGPEVIAMMALVGKEVKRLTGLPTGIQILAGANLEAMAAAYAAGLDFIRAEGFVFAHVADEGLIEASAAELMRYRKQIGAEEILVFTDIKKKHSAHAITADVNIAETAHAAEFFLSDGLIVTGAATGREANLEEIKAVKAACSLPVMVGSGVNMENLADFLELCDGLIIGSWFKEEGRWENTIDPDRVRRLMDKARSIR